VPKASMPLGVTCRSTQQGMAQDGSSRLIEFLRLLGMKSSRYKLVEH
jgi:hypothetical protein